MVRSEAQADRPGAMDTLGDEGKVIAQPQQICRQVHDRQPHLGALQASHLPRRVRECETLFGLPASGRIGNHLGCNGLGFGPAVVGLAQAGEQRVDGVEQVAGGVGRAGEAVIVSIVAMAELIAASGKGTGRPNWA